MIYLDLKNVKKTFRTYGEREVLKGVSMNVSEGEVVSIIGPSGSGKSTLLRIATFLETMDSGQCCYYKGHQTRLRAGVPEFQSLSVYECAEKCY